MKLIDRKKEMESLENYFANAKDGGGRLVLLSGEVGVGKAAIAFELMKRHEKEAACIETSIKRTKTIPYAPFLDRMERWKTYVKTTALLEGVRAEMFSTASGPKFNAGTQERTFSTFDQLFKEVSEEKPVIFFIDRLHFADAGTLALLSHVAETIKTLRVLIIGAFTSDILDSEKFSDFREFLTDLMMKDMLTSIHVDNLSEEDVEEFIKEFLNVRSIDNAFIDEIYRASNGNPLFMEYTMDLFVRERVVKRGEGIVVPLNEIKVPSSFEDIITRVLNMLPEDAVTILKYASVQGTSFLIDVLREQTNMTEEEFRQNISILEREGIIYPIDEERYSFIHSHAQETIYKSCTKVRELHKEVADLIAQLHEKDIETHYLELADHYFKAKEWKTAAKYATLAGNENLRIYSLEDAIFAYNMALTAYKTENEDPRGRGKVLLMLGKIYLLASRWKEAYESVQEAMEIFEKEGDRGGLIESYNLLGDIERERSDLNEAGKWYQKAMELAKEEGDRREIARAARGLGYIDWRQGNYESALKMLAKAENISKEVKDPIYGIVLVDTGNVHSALGDLELARDYYTRAVEELQKSENLWDLARAYNNLGDSYLQSKEWDMALEFFEKCSNVSKKAGLNNYLGWSLFNSAEALNAKGDLEAALTYLDRALPILEKIKDINGLSGVHRDYGLVYLKKGELKKAERSLIEAMRYAEEAEGVDILLDIKTDIAELHIEKDEVERAKELLERALTEAKKLNAEKKIERIEKLLKKVG